MYNLPSNNNIFRYINDRCIIQILRKAVFLLNIQFKIVEQTEVKCLIPTLKKKQ